MSSTSLLRRPVILIAALVGLAVVAWLAFGFFGIQTLFVDDKVDEAIPEFDSAEAAGAPDTSEGAEPDDSEDAAESASGSAESGAADSDADSPESETAIGIQTLAQGQFGDRAHPTEGTALVLTDGSEQRFLRFEDFETDNGPDLNVYLSTASPDAPDGDFDDDFIDLGNLSGNIGNQNYEVPADVDLSQYRTVVIWCVRFGVAFGTAELA